MKTLDWSVEILVHECNLNVDQMDSFT
jgi:hypothetical protein